MAASDPKRARSGGTVLEQLQQTGADPRKGGLRELRTAVMAWDPCGPVDGLPLAGVGIVTLGRDDDS